MDKIFSSAALSTSTILLTLGGIAVFFYLVRLMVINVKIQRAVKLVSQGIETFIVAATEGGKLSLPNSFWDEPYVLGFLLQTAQLLTKDYLRNATDKAINIVAVSALETHSKKSYESLLMKMKQYTENENTDFELACVRARKLYGFIHGEQLEDDNDVLQALTEAQFSKRSGTVEEEAGFKLVRKFWVEAVVKK